MAGPRRHDHQRLPGQDAPIRRRHRRPVRRGRRPVPEAAPQPRQQRPHGTRAGGAAQIECEGDPRYLPYVPRLVESFRLRDADTADERRVNVLAAAPGLVSLAEVRRARPDGLDPRDAPGCGGGCWSRSAWRTAPGSCTARSCPTHVLIEPAEHGVVLVDWCYSVTYRRRHGARARVRPIADWYPARGARAPRSPGPGTDIAMAARCMSRADGPARADRRCARSPAAACMPRLDQRPDDAWRLLARARRACWSGCTARERSAPSSSEEVMMGSGIWSTDVYDAADRYRRASGVSAFAYSDGGARSVHPELDPRGAPRGRAATPTSTRSRRPIAVLFDVTGSMRGVPRVLQTEAAPAARPADPARATRTTRRSCSARSATRPATGCRCRSASSSRTTAWTTTSAGSCWRAAAAVSRPSRTSWPCTSWPGTRRSTASRSAAGAATCSSSATRWRTGG